MTSKHAGTAVCRFGNGTALELRIGDNREFVGLGAVSNSGTYLRNAIRPILVRTDTPEGILYARFRLRDVTQDRAGATEVKLTAIGLPWGRMEYHDDYNQSQIAVGYSPDSVEDDMTLHLAPVDLAISGREWAGFSMSFEFRSRLRRIHRIWSEATWEIGGTLCGNTVLHQGQVNRPVYKGAKSTLFTTHCLKTLTQYGSPMGSSYQLTPRGGIMQPFDFQYSNDGMLFQFWPKMESIASLLESEPGSDRLLVFDEYRFELANHARTTPKWVLFSPGKVAQHEARNVWWEAHEYVNGGIRKQYGVKPTSALPEVGMKYLTRVTKGRLLMRVVDRVVESRRVPYAVADRLLPRLAEQGIKRFFPEVMSESDVTKLGMQRKLDAGIHGDHYCASVCATHRFLPAEFWGGLKGWRYMYARAKDLGMELGAWFSFHLSPRSPYFRDHPEYRMVDCNSMGAGGGYGHTTICVADWNTPVCDAVLSDLRTWKEQAGLDYMFVDSWANLGIAQVNYSAGMRTNLSPAGHVLAELQKMGIKALSFEGISPLGLARCGIVDLRGDRLAQEKAVAGQNDFGWWIGEEDMMFGMIPVVHARKRSTIETERSAFRAMASRACVNWYELYGVESLFPAWWVRLNRIYMHALPYMNRRRLLPGRRGVEWTDGKTSVLWTFDVCPVPSAWRGCVDQIGENGIGTMRHSGAGLPAWGVFLRRGVREFFE